MTLVATTPDSSQIESNSIAASIAGSIGEGAGLAGGGAGATNQITNTVKAYIDDSANVQADNLISVATTDNATIDSSVGTVAVAFGGVGASIGASIQSSTVNNTVWAYINAPVNVTNGDITVSSGSTVSVTGTAVATSVAGGAAAFAGAGANTTSEIDGSVEAYVGPAGALTLPSTGTVTIQAVSNQNAEANSYGVAVSFGDIAAAIGVSLGTATIDGTTEAYLSGTLLVGRSLTVEATNTGAATATIFALAGGVAAFGGAGAGALATINFNPIVTAYIDGRVGNAITPFGGDVTVVATVLTNTNDDAEGVAFATGVSIAGSTADDNIGPQHHHLHRRLFRHQYDRGGHHRVPAELYRDRHTDLPEPR